MKQIKRIFFLTAWILIFAGSIMPLQAEAITNDEYKELMKQAKAGNSEAQIKLINFYYDSEKYKDAIKWCKRLIATSQATDEQKCEAYYVLGDCAFWGDGMSESRKTAYKYYEIGANFGDDACALRLAIDYYDFEHDTKNSLKWYKKAAELGYFHLGEFLGNLYENNGRATMHGRMYYFPEVERNLFSADQYYDFYLNNIKVSKDSKIWYKRARWYYSGEGNIEKDYTRAFTYFSRAIEDNDKSKDENKLSDEEEGDALWHLSVCYRFGRGVEKDDVKAQYYAKQAAEKGNEKAISILNE